MSVRYEVILSCDAQDCEACDCFTDGIGDEPKHAAAAAGWRFTPAGRALCETHARRAWPDSFPKTPAPKAVDDLLA